MADLLRLPLLARAHLVEAVPAVDHKEHGHLVDLLQLAQEVVHLVRVGVRVRARG